MNRPVSRWNPLRELSALQDRQSTSSSRPSTWSYASRDAAFKIPEWAPLVDIIEDHSDYLIKAELPEIQSKDVKVTVQKGVLMITGQRALDQENGKTYHRVERPYGTFARSFTLPEAVEAERLSAVFKDGVLNIRVPKSEKAKPRNIEVRIT